MSFETGSWITATSIASLACYFAVEDVGEDLWDWTNNLQKQKPGMGLQLFLFERISKLLL